MTVIAKYSDYTINPIEYTIDRINTEIALRDLSGLTNGVVRLLRASKQHPLVKLMDHKINPETRNDTMKTSLLPALSVTPANSTEDGFTLGQSPVQSEVDSDFIAALRELQDKTDKEIQEDVLISKKQIEDIIAAYNRKGTSRMLYKKHSQNKKDEVSISLWNETPDLDLVISNVVDSIISTIRASQGDDSPIRFGEYRVTRGLTNFNFGRTIFGTEYSLTFENTYSNYIVYTESYVDFTTVSTDLTYTVPGDEDNGTKISSPE